MGQSVPHHNPPPRTTLPNVDVGAWASFILSPAIFNVPGYCQPWKLLLGFYGIFTPDKPDHHQTDRLAPYMVIYPEPPPDLASLDRTLFLGPGKVVLNLQHLG